MSSAPSDALAAAANNAAQQQNLDHGVQPLGPTATLETIQAAAAAAGQSFDPVQLLNIIRSMPGVFKLDTTSGAMSSKEDAAETLSNLSQAANMQSNPNAANPSDQNIHPQLQGPEPGPSTHPLGPPTTQWAPAEQVGNINAQTDLNGQSMDSGDKGVNVNFMDANGMNVTGGRRFRPGRNNVQIGSEEWHRRKKESHKEVERRRRGNINEGIDALAHIVPNGTGEKAKGAILSRSVQYIHHLKENEARNIEKWTLEKLLMDQAMGDLQGQIDEMKKLLDKEVEASQKKDELINKLKKEIASLKAGKSSDGSNKRSSAEVEDTIDGSDDPNKRQKVV